MESHEQSKVTVVINFKSCTKGTDKLEVSLSPSMLMAAGHYFKALLNKEHKFRESNDSVLFIDSNAIDIGLSVDDWKRYFDIIVGKTTIADMDKRDLEEFVLIAKYLSNEQILDKFREVMYDRMETEPLEEYLKDWIIYFQLSSVLWCPIDSKWILINHLKFQLSFSFTDEWRELVICWKDMHSMHTGVIGQVLDLPLDNYLMFCDICNKYLIGHWNTLLSNTDPGKDCFSLGILDGIDWSNMILAGGAVNRIIDTRISEQELEDCPESDLDLFILGNEDIQRQKVLDLLEWFRSKYGNKLYIGTNRSVMTLWITDVPRIVQIICSNGSNISTILFRFDLTHIQVAYDGQKFLAKIGRAHV